MQRYKKVPCPYCRNGRLFDVAMEKWPASPKMEIDIKCPACRRIVSISFGMKDEDLSSKETDNTM